MENKKDIATYELNQHRLGVQMIIMSIIIPELYNRAYTHDNSSYEEPEITGYRKYGERLANSKYMTGEFMDTIHDMWDSTNYHHIKMNRHHLEHYGMNWDKTTLIDLIEMLIDWMVYSIKDEVNFENGLERSLKGFKAPPTLSNILRNTYEEYLKPFESMAKNKDEKSLRNIKSQVFLTGIRQLYSQELINKIADTLDMMKEEDLENIITDSLYPIDHLKRQMDKKKEKKEEDG